MTPTSPLEPVRTSLPELFDAARNRPDPGFDPTTSPLHGRAVFIVGAPRSGTTWLHQLLAVHPDVATGGEAHVVCEGVASLFRNHEDPDPYMYLSTWVTRGELLQLSRELIDGLFLRARAAQRPQATHVLDKTPNHEPHAGLLAELYPDATFIHIVRDGRDVAASAHDLWSGFGAAYASVEAAAGVWRDAIDDVRRHLSGLRYHEVRYEDLLTDPEAHLGAILDVAGLGHDASFLSEAVEFGRPPINVRPSKAEVGVRKWADAGPEHERAVFQAAGDLLISLGYATEHDRTIALSQRTWKTTKVDLEASARRVASGGLRKAKGLLARRARRQRVAAVDDVRRPATALAEHVVAGTDPGDLLRADANGTIDGRAVEGRDAVLDGLGSVSGGRIAAVTADAAAAFVELVDAGGRRRTHRYFVDAGAVTRVVAE